MSDQTRAEHEWDLWLVHSLINEDDTTLSELNTTKAQMIEQGSKPPLTYPKSKQYEEGTE